MASIQAPRTEAKTDQLLPWCIIAGFLLVMTWSYWNTIQILMSTWTSPQYSHGFLVPIFTAVLLSMRRHPFGPVSASERWAGVGIIAVGLAIRIVAAYLRIVTIDILSIIPVVLGIFVVVGGWSTFRWAAAPIAFLVFMMPLPTAAERTLLNPLQHVATVLSTYTLQTMGVDAYYESNRIVLGEAGIPLNVEEACSGLRMGTIFLAMAVAMTMITERPWWQKGIVILSSIPIALLVNLIRITATALLFMALGPDSELARTFFHDLAGWFMMPVALGFLYAEMQLLDHIVLEESTATPMLMGRAQGASRTATAASPAPSRTR